MDACLAQDSILGESGTSNVVFAHFIQTLLIAQCKLNSESDYPADKTSEVLDRLPNGDFDFIIVGGGTAGSVLARRLSDVSDWNVLLIERGKNPSQTSEVPGLFMTLQGTDEDYMYKVEPGNYCLGTVDKKCMWSKGKMLGGSSAMNAMIHIHGNRKDYDGWAELGNDGWDFDTVLPYFRKAESYTPDMPQKYGEKYFGTTGPVIIRNFNYSNPGIQDMIMDAVKEVKIPILDVINGEENMGYGRVYGAVENGFRRNVAKSFLKPVKDRTNLFVMKSARVDSIKTRDKRATGVKVTLNNGKTVEITAKKEVILSAGGIATPQILMLSGIGPKKELEDLKIEVVADLPVGKNLQDHLVWFGIHMTFDNHTMQSTSSVNTLDTTYNYLVHRKGNFMATAGLDLMGFINTKEKNAKYPNIQFHNFYALQGDKLTLGGIAQLFAYNKDMKTELFQTNRDSNVIIIGPTLLNPKSVGEVKLRSANPGDPPIIFANYLTEKDDLDVMLDSVDFVCSLLKTEAFKKYNVKFRRFDIEECKDFADDSRDYWECNLRHVGATIFHPVGTAKMGPAGDSEAVVDPKLKVHGIDGLRVIDASIMPLIVSGNTNSPTMMIAEKGSDMIIKEWTKNDT